MTFETTTPDGFTVSDKDCNDNDKYVRKRAVEALQSIDAERFKHLKVERGIE